MYNIGVGLVLGIEYFWPPTIIYVYQYQHLGIGIPPKDPTYSSSFVGNHVVVFALNANICNRVSVMSAFGMVLHWIFDDWSWIEKQMSILYREVWWIVIRLKIPNSLADTANARAGSKTDLFYRGSLTSLTTSGSSSPASASVGRLLLLLLLLNYCMLAQLLCPAERAVFICFTPIGQF